MRSLSLSLNGGCLANDELSLNLERLETERFVWLPNAKTPSQEWDWVLEAEGLTTRGFRQRHMAL